MKSLILLLLLLPAYSIAQSSDGFEKKMDSLELIFRSDQSDTLRLKAGNEIATTYVQNGKYQEGYSYCNEIIPWCDSLIEIKKLNLKESILFKKVAAASRINLGTILARTGNFQLSIEACDEAIQISKEIEHHKSLASAYNVKATAYAYQGRLEEGLEFFLLALDVREKAGDKAAASASNKNIGNIYSMLGRFDEAVEYYTKSLEYTEKVNDEIGSAKTYLNLGASNRDRGNYAQSYDYLMKALDVFHQSKDVQSVSAIHMNLGNLYNSKGDYNLALAYFDSALVARIELGDLKVQNQAYNAIGASYFMKKEWGKSLEFYNKSLEMSLQTGDKAMEAFNYSNLAGIHLTLAVEIEKGNPKRDSLLELSNDLYQKSLNLELEISRRNSISDSYRNLAQVRFAQDKISESLELALMAKKYADSSGALVSMKEVRRPLILNYRSLDQIDLAVSELNSFQDIIMTELELNYFNLPEKEKELYFEKLEWDFSVFYTMAGIYGKEYPALLDTAFNMALEFKGLSMKSSTLMRQSILGGTDTVLKKKYRDWLEMKKLISQKHATGEEVGELENQANKIEKELVAESDLFGDYKKLRFVKWETVQENLSEDQIAIEFIRLDDKIDLIHNLEYYALIVKKGIKHPIAVKLCSENELLEVLGEAQSNNLEFVNKTYGTSKKTNKALYEKIWKPIEPYLKGIEDVYYSPVGSLHRISFAAISNSNDLFLCDNYNLLQQTSTGKTVLAKKDRTIDLNYVLFGGVDYNSNESQKEIWKFLPGTVEETQVITDILHKNDIPVQSFMGKEASEPNFKETVEGSSHIHISTHGYFYPDPKEIAATTEVENIETEEMTFRGATSYANWTFVSNENPLMRSGIVLANANDVWHRSPLDDREDGILTAQEVSHIDMTNTELVVLSACETGLGDIKGSEGVYGLQRAFKMAGVKYLIMSLWQVPDKETAEFMTTFYENLTKTDNIELAFKKTQSSMRKKYDPYYWAAFVLLQ